MLIVCVHCKKQLNYTKMGVWGLYNNEVGAVTRVYRGDMYECKDCEYTVICDFGKAITRENHPSGSSGFDKLITAIIEEDEKYIMFS